MGQAMVPFQALQAFCVAVDAVCPGKLTADVYRTAKYMSYKQVYILL